MAYQSGSHHPWTTIDEERHIRYIAGSTKGGTLEAKEAALVGYLEAADRRVRWDSIDKHRVRFVAQERLREVRDEIARTGGE